MTAKRVRQLWRTMNGPIVSTIPNAANVLGVDAAWLAARVERANLEPWGQHSDGSDVFKWPALLELASVTRPGRAGGRAKSVSTAAPRNRRDAGAGHVAVPPPVGSPSPRR